MENGEASGSINVALLKKESLRRAYDQANAQANLLMLFLIQWKDLDDQFDSMGRELNERFQTVEAREKFAEEQIRVAECKEMELCSVQQRFIAKEKELCSVQQRIEECEMDFRREAEKLGFLMERLDFCEREICMNEEKLNFVEENCRKKEEELISLCCSADELNRKIEEKGTELRSLERSISEFHVTFTTKEAQFASKIASKSKELISLCCSADERNQEIEEKEKKLRLLIKSISEFHEKFALKSKDLELHEERLSEVKRLIRDSSAFHKEKEAQFTSEIDSKRKELESLENSILECSKRFDSKTDQLELISKRAVAFFDDRGRNLDIREMNIVEKERQFQNQQLEELKRQQQRLCMTTTIPVGSPVPRNDFYPNCSPNSSNASQLKIEPVNLAIRHEDNFAAPVPQYTETIHGDTAGMALDAINKSYEQMKGEKGFQPEAMRKQIHLLEQLTASSLPITPQVKQAARDLAGKLMWELRADQNSNSLEVLGFLHLLAAYQLAPFFNRIDILRFIETYSLRDKAPELCQNLVAAALVLPSLTTLLPQQRNKKRPSSSPVLDEQVTTRKR